jgi:hypothetical protein
MLKLSASSLQSSPSPLPRSVFRAFLVQVCTAMSDSGAVKVYLDVNISSKNALARKLERCEIDRGIFNLHRFHNRIKRYAN